MSPHTPLLDCMHSVRKKKKHDLRRQSLQGQKGRLRVWGLGFRGLGFRGWLGVDELKFTSSYHNTGLRSTVSVQWDVTSDSIKATHPEP